MAGNGLPKDKAPMGRHLTLIWPAWSPHNINIVHDGDPVKRMLPAVPCWERVEADLFQEMATFGDMPYREFAGAGRMEDQVKEWVVNQCGNPGDPSRFHRLYQRVMKLCWAYDPMVRFPQIITDFCNGRTGQYTFSHCLLRSVRIRER